jgi:polyhydroxyalkanoate synthesis regulator phasin
VAMTRPKLPRSTEEQLRQRLESLRDLAMLPAKLIQEALDDAVARGRMTREDATELAATLLDTGRKQTRELLDELEGSLRGGPGEDIRERILAELQRVRRALGLGPMFPITGYDDLTAPEVIERLDQLTAPQLRKVRDHETRHRKRKTVLAAIAEQLAPAAEPAG